LCSSSFPCRSRLTAGPRNSHLRGQAAVRMLALVRARIARQMLLKSSGENIGLLTDI
jgi:hypothetical protein